MRNRGKREEGNEAWKRGETRDREKQNRGRKKKRKKKKNGGIKTMLKINSKKIGNIV